MLTLTQTETNVSRIGFQIHRDRDALCAAIQKLEPFKLGAYASAESIEGRAEYVRRLTKLVADHIEVCAADADSSTSSGPPVGEEDAQGIADVGTDLAAAILGRS